MSIAGNGLALQGFGGGLAADCTCCEGGGPPTCPTDCSACLSKLCFTFLCGTTTTQVEYTRSGCAYSGDDGSQIVCVDGIWIINPNLGAGNYYWSSPGGCPNGPYTLHRTDPLVPCPTLKIISVVEGACGPGGPCPTDCSA